MIRQRVELQRREWYRGKQNGKESMLRREVGIGGGRGVFWNFFFFEKRGGGVWRGGMGVFLVGLGNPSLVKWV